MTWALLSACGGQIFIAAPDVSTQDLCKNVSCQLGTFCSSGQCLPVNLSGPPCNPINLAGACPAGETCATGTCYPSAATPPLCATGVNGQCSPGLSCNSGNGVCGATVTACAPGTDSDPNTATLGQCQGAQRCVEGYCFFDTNLDCSAAMTSGVCPANEQCGLNGTCAVITGTPCDPNNFSGNCSAWEVCSQGHCVGPTPPVTLACSPNNITGLCPANELCVSGVCTEITTANACNTNNLSGLCAAGAGCIGPTGYCEVLTASNACSTSHPTGGCSYGGSCVKGICVQTPCGQPGGFACTQGYRCDTGQCVAVPCDAVHPGGTCVDSAKACLQGICVAPSCALDPGPGVGKCPGNEVCRSDGQCTPPDCAITGNQNSTNNYCPNSHDVCSSAGVCVRRECSLAILDGVCTGTEATVNITDPYHGKVPVAAVCCDANLQTATSCVLGNCSAPLCAQQPNALHGVCTNSGSDYCDNGNCVTAPCTAFFQQGHCSNANEVCVTGTCTLPNCVTASNPNAYCAPKLCDRNPAHVATSYNTCVSPACSDDPNIGTCSPGTACCNPNLVLTGDPNCTGPTDYGSCISPACSYNYPGGACPTGKVCTPTLSCDPNSANNNCCSLPPCSNATPTGNCGPNFTCTAQNGNYACAIEMCSPLAPKGTCALGSRCYNASIGDPNYGHCEPFVCSDYYPTAPCTIGEQCTLSGGHYSCQVPSCGLTYPAQPGGVCADSNQVCVAGVCITPACSTAYLAGACPSSQECCDSALVTARSCQLGACTPRACDASHLNGYCANGKVCCNAALTSSYSQCAANQGTCQNEVCSTTYPSGPCPTVGDICVTGACKTPCSSTARKGWCPTGFACVNGACGTSCTNDFDCDNIDNATECPGSPSDPSACMTDTDGDGSPDSVDRDSDNDGIPDVVERGCVASASCTPTTTPTSTTTGTYDFRNLDSDGDKIGDFVEAGLVPSLPQDTDHDHLPNYRDPDSDGDGILDLCEATDAYGVCNSGNTLILQTSGVVDTNANGKPDYMDLDSDSDGVSDHIEATDKTGTFQANGVYTRGPGFSPDYRNTDSDGDGVPDKQEDVNGNGIVDCQLSGNGNFVADPRPSPACAAASSGTGLYYNPGCNCSTAGNPNGCVTPGQKCLFAETSRVEIDTNLNTIHDPNDGVFQVCGENNLKKINLFYSQTNDYAFALERSFQKTSAVVAGNGNTVGLAFDDENNDSPTGSINGSYAVSGMLLTKAPSTAAIAQATLIQKAITQAQGDGTLMSSSPDVASASLVINRNFTSFDGFGAVVSRYHVLTQGSITAWTLRNALAKVIDSSDLGSASLPTSVNTATFNDFTVNMETLYRYDDGLTGRVVVVLAVTPTGVDQTSVDTYNYRTDCTGYSSAGPCLGEHGCTYTTGSCVARQDYQIPLFFADNITNGSALTQYGSDIASLCQSLVQQNSVLDFMWVVDNSISMAPKIGQVSKASDLFFGLLNNTEANYRVGMVTSAPSMDNQAAAGSTIWEPIYPGCFAQTSKTTCETDPQVGGCSWDSTHNTCTPLCSPYTTAGTCAAAGCSWNPNGCYFGGCNSITDSTLCGNVSCFWNATTSRCTHTSRGDRANGSLIADFTGAVSGRYLASTDRSVAYQCNEGCAAEDQTNGTLPTGLYDKCGNVPMDPNYNNPNATIAANAQALNAATCDAYPQCYWNASACVANCCPICNGIGGTAPDPNTPFDNAACYFASRLPGDDGNGFEFGLLMGEWAMYRAGAHAGCAAATDMASCPMISGCTWYTQGNQCIAATCAFTPNLPASVTAADQCNGNYPGSAPTGSQAQLIKDINSPSGSSALQSMPEPAGCEYSPDTGTCLPSLGVPCTAYNNASTNFPTASCPTPRCVLNGGYGCVPNPTYNDVQCSASDAVSCSQQGPNWCTWDNCTGYSTATDCGTVYGCVWNGSCLPVANGDTCSTITGQPACMASLGCAWDSASSTCGIMSNRGTCRPPLSKSIRANATRVAVLLSDEEECYVKDGASGGHAAAYDGRCEFVNYGGGLLDYSDQNRVIRTNAYLNAFASRNFLTFAIVGDKADATLPAGGGSGLPGTGAVAWWQTASCPSGCTWYSGDPTNPTSTNTGIARLQAVCVSTANPNLLCPKANGGCFNQIPNGPLVEAEAGQAYINVAEGTGGGWGSICAGNLYPSIESTVIASVSKASPYHLNGFVDGHAVQPIASTIQVGVQVCSSGSYPDCGGSTSNTKVIVPLARSRTNGFDYDPSNNALVLYGSARAFTEGDIVVSYRYWVNTYQPVAGADPSCPCPGTSLSSNCACDAGKSCGVSGPNPLPPGVNLCSTVANNANETVCNRVAGCVWNSVIGCEPTGVCEYDPTCGGRCTTGEVCDSSTGLCMCDLGCGAGCPAGKACDTDTNTNCTNITSANICNGQSTCHWNPDLGQCDSITCGTCVCDTSCGGGCPAGQACDHNGASATCGQCSCDTTCNGGCPANQTCNTDTASPTCGFCEPPACSYTDTHGVKQQGCPPGDLCDLSTGTCMCDTSCGGSCRAGTACDSNTTSPTCGLCECDTSCGNVTCAAGQTCDSNPAHTNTCGLCVVDTTCGGSTCNPTCSGGTVGTCTGDSNCIWKTYKNGGMGACGPKACGVCNPVAGLCTADNTCCGGCGPQQTCDTSSGTCVCDTTCGGACQVGYTCDSDPAHLTTCGTCLCDTTCGGACPVGDRCNSDTSSTTCGLCVVDPTCGGGCPYPYQCNASTGLCIPPPCGVCPNGYTCNPLTLQCTRGGGG